jgi:ABC-type multidrug transport system ATPase subunit
MLDPISRERVFDVLAKIKQEQSNTIIVIEHNLEKLIPLADKMILLLNGELLLEDKTEAFFQKMDLLTKSGINPPGGMGFFHRLSQAGYYNGALPLTLPDAAEKLNEVFEKVDKKTRRESRYL